MNRIKIHSGKLIDIDNPQEEISKLDIADISIGLNTINRFNGQHPLNISVAFHSITASNLAAHYDESIDVQLFLLFHDAQELVLSDVPSPVKKSIRKYNISDYDILEIDWKNQIYLKFVGRLPSLNEEEIIRKYDEMAYDFEVGLWQLQSYFGNREVPNCVGFTFANKYSSLKPKEN